MVRFKNRYLLCLIETEFGSDADVFSLQPREILAAVRSSLSTNFGDLGVGQTLTSLAVKLWSPALGMCIIRCSRDFYRTVWAATSLITTMTALKRSGLVRFAVIHVGGTIRTCQKSAAQHARHLILEKRSAGIDTKEVEVAALFVKNEIEAMDV